MKRSWIIGGVVVAGIVVVSIVLNYQAEKHAVPLSELFKEENKANNVEYEFVGNAEQPAENSAVPQNIKKEEKKVAAPAIIPTPKASAVTTDTEFKKIPFTIQVASFKEKDKAEKILEALKKKDYSAYIVARNLGDKGIWYRVYVGRFDTPKQAEELLTKIKEEYKSSFIIAPNKK